MTLVIASQGSSVNTDSRPRLDAATQVAMLAGLWFGYAAVRHLTDDTQHSALGNAARLLDVESALGVDVEAVLQSAVTWPHVFVAANTYYLVHFPLTLAVMALAFWQHRATTYSVLRNSLIGSTVVALLLHLVVPMAPPRMLPGFVDAGATYGPDPYAIAGSESANQFAAMPSLHVAWAVLIGCALWRLSTWRIVRSLAVVHPLVTSLVVVITGHHFVADVGIGAALAITFITIASASNRRPLKGKRRGSHAGEIGARSRPPRNTHGSTRGGSQLIAECLQDRNRDGVHRFCPACRAMGSDRSVRPRTRDRGAAGGLHLDEDLVDGHTWRFDEVFGEASHGRLERGALA